MESNPVSGSLRRRGARSIVALGWLLLSGCSNVGVASADLAVIPAPLRAEAAAGAFRLTPQTVVWVDPLDVESRRAAQFFTGLVRGTCGIELSIQPSKTARAAGGISFRRRADAAPPHEGYTIDVTPQAIVISGGGAGIFYGGVTLWQLVSPDGTCGSTNQVAAGRIEDLPRFAWRGFMLDSSRHLQSPETIKDLIDWMATKKLNTLHWHLSDNQGWRLEIRRYPRLTEVGAWRTPLAIEPSGEPEQSRVKPQRYGGFYTQEQVRDIVRYAQQRHVTIVPEIDVPAHSLAALVSYPELSAAPKPATTVAADTGLHLDLYNLEEATFTFLENVFAEVIELFPSEFIHIGGDEVMPYQWLLSERIQDRVEELDILERDMTVQGYFTHRLDRFLAAHGRRLIGWDEILDGGPLSDGAAVMSWRGTAGATRAAQAEHETVLTPYPVYYFNLTQARSDREPPSWMPLVTLQEVYAFDPTLPELDAEQQQRVLGVQGNVWTEVIDTDERIERMAFPRATAMAETAWSAEAQRDWTSFVHRLAPSLVRDRTLGLEASLGAFTPQMAASPAEDGALVTLTTQVDVGRVRYTLDGTDPTLDSPVYDQPLTLSLPTRVNAALFVDERRVSSVVERRFTTGNIGRRSGHTLELCPSGLMFMLEDDGPPDGPRARFPVSVTNPCWIYRDAPLSNARSIVLEVADRPNVLLPTDLAWLAARPLPPEPDDAPHGAIEVRQGDCQGPIIASLPLPAPEPERGLVRLQAGISPEEGERDLCLLVNSRQRKVLWGLASVSLID